MVEVIENHMVSILTTKNSKRFVLRICCLVWLPEILDLERMEDSGLTVGQTFNNTSIKRIGIHTRKGSTLGYEGRQLLFYQDRICKSVTSGNLPKNDTTYSNSDMTMRCKNSLRGS
nr:ASN_HP1_G0028550.mRNA.1.CDS.1 [Saccharomyces cerevisiae]